MGRPVEVGEPLIPRQVHTNGLPSHRCSLEALRSSDDLEAEETSAASAAGWDSVPGLDAQQLEVLQKAATKGVFWQHPTLQISRVFALHYGGDVEADGNCLFTAVQRAMQLTSSPTQIRLRTVQKFMEDYETSDAARREQVDKAIKNLYSPNMSSGWGVHVVQELKLLARKDDRAALETEIEDLMQVGMSRDSAMESVYNERCIHVQDASSWAKYMSTSGQASDEYDILTLLYTEEGLLSVETNTDGRAAAFGDDIAIEALASEFQRQVFVVQVHGKDLSSEGLLFFLPHTPKQEINHPPLFLLMRGTGWCGAGGDHYEPVLAKALPVSSKEKAAFIL